MKLIVVNDWWSDKMAHNLNKDGLLKALDIFQKEYGWDVKFVKKSRPGFFQHEYVLFQYTEDPKKLILEEKPDAILFFGDLSRPLLGELKDCGIPIALAFSGGTFTNHINVPDIIFVESEVYLKRLSAMRENIIQTYGTNTEVFKPTRQPKVFDAVFPATFATWKRHKLFAEARQPGDGNWLACGWFQPREKQCWKVCQDNGITMLHHQNAESMNFIYNMSRTCVITSDSSGGSQRTVLEAMAVGIPPIVMEDSDKTTEYVKESGFGKIVPPNPEDIREAVREFVANPPDPQKGIDYIKSKYTAHHYAEEMKQGILKICYDSKSK